MAPTFEKHLTALVSEYNDAGKRDKIVCQVKIFCVLYAELSKLLKCSAGVGGEHNDAGENEELFRRGVDESLVVAERKEHYYCLYVSYKYFFSIVQNNLRRMSCRSRAERRLLLPICIVHLVCMCVCGERERECVCVYIYTHSRKKIIIAYIYM